VKTTSTDRVVAILDFGSRVAGKRDAKLPKVADEVPESIEFGS
jgi:hypothetical protein